MGFCFLHFFFCRYGDAVGSASLSNPGRPCRCQGYIYSVGRTITTTTYHHHNIQESKETTKVFESMLQLTGTSDQCAPVDLNPPYDPDVSIQLLA